MTANAGKFSSPVRNASWANEAADDAVRAAFSYRRVAGFSDILIAATVNRRGAHPLYTFGRQAAQMEGAARLGMNPG